MNDGPHGGQNIFQQCTVYNIRAARKDEGTDTGHHPCRPPAGIQPPVDSASIIPSPARSTARENPHHI